MIPSLARGVAIAVTVLAYGYLLNGLADAYMDRRGGKNPLAGFRGRTGPYRAVIVVLGAIALVLSASGSFPAIVATATALTSGTLYSVGPRLKRFPIVCTLLNVGCFAPLLFVGTPDREIFQVQWALGAAFVALLLQNQLLHEAADAEDDARGGVRTTFSVLGPAGTAVLAMLLGSGLVLAALCVLVLRGAPAALALSATPFVVIFPWSLARHGSNAQRMLRTRTTHRMSSAALGALLFAVATFV